MSRSLILAGRLDALGDSWLGTLEDWGDKGLKVALIAIVVITVVRKVSLKAGIGALIGLVLALGIYNSRNSLANIFEDEVNNPANTQPAVTVVVEEKAPAPGGVM
uniref:hypothetical protein n=1 Tax=Streptomyces sp. ADI97-07 TaxID=1522762 RepID=UPI000FBA1659|nr:hypothetical protein [Streptomyces sp. ADI97-07]RPK71519.1 hypothetical protein EES45_34525 [Streptomyces sp. ADI97-07]